MLRHEDQSSKYLVVDGKLTKVTELNGVEDWWIIGNGFFDVYREDEYGPLISEKEAREKFPEEFI